MTLTGLTPSTTYDVYCMSVSRDNVATDLAAMRSANYSLTTATACCKTMTVTLLSQNYYVSTPHSGVIRVQWDAPPATILTLNVTAVSLSSGSIVTGMFFPSSFTVSNRPLAAMAVSLAWTGMQTIGSFDIVLSSSNGTNGNDALLSAFAVAFPQGSTFNVIDKTTEPPTPVPSSAQFSNDGTLVTVSFSAMTNRNGSTANEFPCSRLLSFANSSIATCKWQDDSTIAVYPGAGSQLRVSSQVIVLGQRL